MTEALINIYKLNSFGLDISEKCFLKGFTMYGQDSSVRFTNLKELLRNGAL